MFDMSPGPAPFLLVTDYHSSFNDYPFIDPDKPTAVSDVDANDIEEKRDVSVHCSGVLSPMSGSLSYEDFLSALSIASPGSRDLSNGPDGRIASPGSVIIALPPSPSQHGVSRFFPKDLVRLLEDAMAGNILASGHSAYVSAEKEVSRSRASSPLQSPQSGQKIQKTDEGPFWSPLGFTLPPLERYRESPPEGFMPCAPEPSSPAPWQASQQLLSYNTPRYRRPSLTASVFLDAIERATSLSRTPSPGISPPFMTPPSLSMSYRGYQEGLAV